MTGKPSLSGRFYKGHTRRCIQSCFCSSGCPFKPTDNSAHPRKKKKRARQPRFLRRGAVVGLPGGHLRGVEGGGAVGVAGGGARQGQRVRRRAGGLHHALGVAHVDDHDLPVLVDEQVLGPREQQKRGHLIFVGGWDVGKTEQGRAGPSRAEQGRAGPSRAVSVAIFRLELRCSVFVNTAYATRPICMLAPPFPGQNPRRCPQKPSNAVGSQEKPSLPDSKPLAAESTKPPPEAPPGFDSDETKGDLGKGEKHSSAGGIGPLDWRLRTLALELCEVGGVPDRAAKRNWFFAGGGSILTFMI